MILGQIAWVDCIAFLVFLAPQLILHVGLFDTVKCALTALPFLFLQLPYQFLNERYFTSRARKSPFVQHATPFQDIVIRCVRYAFACIPAVIGKVFFSKGVALPFLHFRMLRHGIIHCPIFWKEVNRDDLKGIFMVHDETQRPDIVILYCHGGGFSMGSSYFYMEFLMAWISMLKDAGYRNPALFALEYTLVPEATYPTQVQEALAAYKYVLSIAPEPSRIIVGGDSAGATLVLSLLLCLSNYTSLKKSLPGLAVLISPWSAIISEKNANTTSDYLNEDSLRLYGSQYIGTKASANDSMVSPGRCQDIGWWKRASPSAGWCFVWGKEEVFAPETRQLIDLLRKTGKDISEREEAGWVHAWPVVKLFLCKEASERTSGLRGIVSTMKERIPISPSKD